VTDPGSAEGSYYVWVDWLDTFGLGRNVPIAMGNLNDSIYALVDGKLITLCVPYPMGMFAKNVDGRIDDPNAGWKGKACDWRGRIPNCYSRPERSQYRSVRSRMPVLSGCCCWFRADWIMDNGMIRIWQPNTGVA
jgi:hypothetical protein